MTPNNDSATIRPQMIFTQHYIWSECQFGGSFLYLNESDFLTKIQKPKVNVMKKTLVALAVTAFAASASAVTVYENEGTKVDMDGSLRLLLSNSGSKTDGKSTKRAHSNLHNDGSRFGVRVKHDIAEDFYALGRLELRFDGSTTTSDKFGDLYAKRAYVGLGSKQYGELTFGRQLTIGDDVHQAGFDYTYGVWDTTLVTSSNSVVRYDYKGVEGLQVGVDYRFAEDRIVEKRDAAGNVINKDKIGEVDSGKAKSGYSAAVLYGFDVTEGQKVKLAAGYTRDNYVSDTSAKAHKDAWGVGAKYIINNLTLAADYSGAFIKKGKEVVAATDSVTGVALNGTKERVNAFRVGVKYDFTPAIAVYGNYGHGVAKDKNHNDTVQKRVYDRYMLGTSYQLHKNVLTYVEGSIAKVKKTTYYTTSTAQSKTTEKNIGVGLRVFW